VTLTTQKYFYKLFVWYLVVKPARVNAALDSIVLKQVKLSAKSGKTELMDW